jgi:D-alanine-D-alanine ligase-like ATP-grasp enzyme
MISVSEIENDICAPFAKGSSGDFLVQALASRGISYRYLSRSEITNPKLARRKIVEFAINGKFYYFDDGTLRVSDSRGVHVPGPNINGSSARFVWRKDLVKTFLHQRGFNVPEGAAFPRDRLCDAEYHFANLCASVSTGVCVKPAASNRGRRVFIHVRDLQTFRVAFAAVGEHHTRVLIEEMLPGPVYRFMCFLGRVLAIRTGRPANVEGDGSHTIAELVALKNIRRRLNSTHAPYPLRLGRRELLFLRQAGLTPSHVPAAGTLVFFNDLSNLHQGADIIDATDTVHPSYSQLIERAITQVPNLVHCGPDVVIRFPSAPATRDNYHILELNGNGPNLSAHHNPWGGQPRDVAGSIIDLLTTDQGSTRHSRM